MDADATRDDLFAVLNQQVDELLDGSGIQSPPVDALQIAQHHLEIPVASDRPRTRRIRDRIELAAGDDATVHQWTAALAIGDRVKPELLRRLELEKGCMLGVSPARLFAQRLLTPSRWFDDDARQSGFDVLELKENYSTAPYEVVALRMLDLPDPCVVTIFDGGRVSKRKSNGFAVGKKLAPAEIQCQQIVHEQGIAHVIQQDSWTVQGWPVHHLDVKREILRSVVDGE